MTTIEGDLMEPSKRPVPRLRGRVSVIVFALVIAMVSAGIGAWASHFSDVPDDHAFHDEIAWMADRGISEGFADGTFRPGDEVTRQAVAAFMERLGDVMTPQPFATTGPGATICPSPPCSTADPLDLDVDPVVCQAPAPTKDYEQRAVLDGRVSVQADGGTLDFWAYPVYRVAGASDWTRMSPSWSTQQTVGADEHGTLPVSGHAGLDPSTNYEFGIQLVRAGGGSVDARDYWCTYRGELQHRQPSS